MAKKQSSSLNPDYYGGMSAAAASGKDKSKNKSGGSSGSSHGAGKGGRGGGSSFLAPLSSKNEAAAEHATTDAIKKGTSQAIYGHGKGAHETPGLKGGEKELKQSYGNARDALSGGLTQARTDLTGARDAATQRVDTAAAQARGDIIGNDRAARGQLTAGENKALGYLDPYAQASSGAAGLYAGSIGLGGQAGHDAAVGAFQTDPGYEFAMEQGLTGIDRRAASRGELGSGNNNIDAITYSQGLANQQYGSWQDRLANEQAFGAGIANQQGTIATGAAGARANSFTGQGQDIANIGTTAAKTGADYGMTTGTGLANAGLNTAGTTANLWQSQGGQAYDYAKDIANLENAKQLGIGQAQTDFQLSKNQTGANAYGLISGGINTALTAGGYGGYGAKSFSSPTSSSPAYTPPSTTNAYGIK